ncbi:radical SAM protein [Bosea sp. 685]|uniref:B12-binding domain-containing radical SAM protein n=1 Tax=Bosea sp. 685 TaxID=3080057 RepID=UPI0028937F5F|nr:radical SAM protein [Bosea sp. 685]WNJ89606.1 radical SAM protein [Bosea sp. 685]
MKIALIQLPFPSQSDPDPDLTNYYKLYGRMLKSILPTYSINENDLWEAPLWVAHLDGAIGREDTTFVDLSTSPFDVEICSSLVRDTLKSSDYVAFFSPLAQNFDLARGVSATLQKCGLRTVVGGNMSRLARPGDFSTVYHGLARGNIHDELVAGEKTTVTTPVVLGRNQTPLGYRPNYRFLNGYAARVPMVRINASHGCLYGCTFCGDAWSKQLHVVQIDDLKAEFSSIENTFPAAQIIYVGDKTFGQSSEAVDNLIKAKSKGNRYKYIVQSHVQIITDKLIDKMSELGVVMVEMGFETADSDLLRGMKKSNSTEKYRQTIELLTKRGMSVVLNVLGGLPASTPESHSRTIEFLNDVAGMTSMYNIYNFVPYPMTPIFSQLKDRIIDWEFKNWREDKIVVFNPYKQTRQAAWNQFTELISTCSTNVARRLQERDSSFSGEAHCG